MNQHEVERGFDDVKSLVWLGIATITLMSWTVWPEEWFIVVPLLAWAAGVLLWLKSSDMFQGLRHRLDWDPYAETGGEA